VARKNGNGEGSRPRKRPDGRWEARYWAETSAGKRRRSVYGSTRKEVVDKLADVSTKNDDAPVAVPTNTTVGGFLAQYEDVAKGTMKRRSFETYKDIARVHLLPALGTSKLKDLSREQVQRLYVRKLDQGLSAARVRRIHGTLSAALNKAVLWRLVARNVCKEVSPPRVETPAIRPLSLDEAKRFLAAAESDERYHALYVLGLTSGARWGELTGLFWSDLDLSRRVMHVQRSLVKGSGGYTFEGPKTRGSRRSVGLAKKATDALLRHRERRAAEGFAVSGDALVFVNTVGKPVNHSHFTRRNFKATLGRAGLPDTTWHAATRHTCTCILLLERVNPKSVAMQMGWSSVAFMLEHYARFMPGWGTTALWTRYWDSLGGARSRPERQRRVPLV
jgi:integrase